MLVEQQRHSRHDLLTIIAIAVLAYILANVLHEGLGHGGACWEVGGVPHVLSTVHFDCGVEGLPDWKGRLVAAAGVLSNALAGAVFYLLWRFLRSGNPAVRYFLLLSSAINLFEAGGYLVFLYPFGVGDGAAFSDAPWAFRPLFALAGIGLYALGRQALARGLNEFLHHDTQWHAEAQALSKTPYLAGCTAVCAASVANPLGWKLLLGSAIPSTYLGTIGLAKAGNKLRPSAPRFAVDAVSARPVIGRSVSWWILAALAFGLYAFALGPGWRF